ncbi:cytosolic protein [Bacillus sp. HMF5848]|uniref:cytosolic protein n=1 Tax=Bacillus sp. HMF5848 TaxID=2495421 RepID=UPI000F78611B|nr:cytosolic protein [Bacillus sp. HMF5848]RSK28118.1 cytosolic protein [Bacillus sp. HMF5848]
MSLLGKLRGFFSTHSETKENHSNELLQTHYYKSSQDKTFTAVQELLNNMDGIEVTSVSKERGEISANVIKGKKAFIVATVISVRPFETAVDFSIATETALPFDFGYSQKWILKIYDAIGKQLNFIGVGLNKD